MFPPNFNVIDKPLLTSAAPTRRVRFLPGPDYLLSSQLLQRFLLPVSVSSPQSSLPLIPAWQRRQLGRGRRHVGAWLASDRDKRSNGMFDWESAEQWWQPTSSSFPRCFSGGLLVIWWFFFAANRFYKPDEGKRKKGIEAGVNRKFSRRRKFPLRELPLPSNLSARNDSCLWEPCVIHRHGNGHTPLIMGCSTSKGPGNICRAQDECVL